MDPQTSLYLTLPICLSDWRISVSAGNIHQSFTLGPLSPSSLPSFHSSESCHFNLLYSFPLFFSQLLLEEYLVTYVFHMLSFNHTYLDKCSYFCYFPALHSSPPPSFSLSVQLHYCLILPKTLFLIPHSAPSWGRYTPPVLL